MARENKIKELFKIFDSDEKNYISKQEFKKCLLSTIKKYKNNNPGEFYDLLKQIDDHKDENLTYDDLKKFFNNSLIDVESKTQLSDDDIVRLFNLIDYDNQNKIGFKEILKLVNDIGAEMQNNEIIELLKYADTNKDGYLDIYDFKKIMKCRFAW